MSDNPQVDVQQNVIEAVKAILSLNIESADTPQAKAEALLFGAFFGGISEATNNLDELNAKLQASLVVGGDPSTSIVHQLFDAVKNGAGFSVDGQLHAQNGFGLEDCDGQTLPPLAVPQAGRPNVKS